MQRAGFCLINEQQLLSRYYNKTNEIYTIYLEKYFSPRFGPRVCWLWRYIAVYIFSQEFKKFHAKFNCDRRISFSRESVTDTQKVEFIILV